jgi:serine protease Do
MRRNKGYIRSLWLPLALAAAGAFALWQVGPAPPVQARAAVDELIQAQTTGLPSFANVIEAVQPAVVNISVSGSLETGPEPGDGNGPPTPFGNDFEDFLRRFFERQSFRGDAPGPGSGPGAGPTFQGMGSGFIVDPTGYVVTNNHVVDHASDVTVTLHDGKRLPAKLIGTDPKTDLALLKVETKEALPYARFGDSATTRVGDWVVAIGNPFGLGGTATAGIVSARGRDIQSGPFDDFLQIDAPINRGNSGGPLFDLSGRVIGINTAIYTPNGGSVGIGFAIPAKLAQPVIDDLRKNGKVERGFLGVTIQQVDDDIAKGLGLESAKGALVASVVKGGPADKAGMRAGDVIVSIDGTPVDQVKELTRKVAGMAPDRDVPIEVLRNAHPETLRVHVGEAPSDDAPVAGVDAPAHESARGLGLKLGALTPEMRQRLGVSNDVEGAVIVGVAQGSGAAQKGLRPGDIVVMVGQTPVASPEAAAKEVEREKSAGREAVLLRVLREGQAIFVPVPFA